MLAIRLERTSRSFPTYFSFVSNVHYCCLIMMRHSFHREETQVSSR
ncbi:hypothetical protein HMPREF0973_02856 [Prevotella veroralis F0319]|uniref:Uncharacterized protein n=1 Tax=Prevotella veroralis F0319 TaxID=649761 RepID=C9MT85_9BACT|nr:hypothetical protein HMPREF0973_02856 [Prevotella veroralis F0319]